MTERSHDTDPDRSGSSTVFAGDAPEMPEELRRAIETAEARLAEPAEPAGVDDLWADAREFAATTDAIDDADEADALAALADAERKLDPSVRRLRWIVVTVAGLVLVAMATMFAPAYRVDVPALELRDGSGQTHMLNGATATVSTWDLTHQETVDTGGRLARGAGPRPDDWGGVPKSHATLLAMLGLVVAGFALRLSLPAGLGVIAGFFAMKQLTAMRAVIESGRADAPWVTPLWGVELLALLVGLAMSATAGLAIQVFVVNLHERRAEVAAAEVAGVEPPSTVFSRITSLVGRQVARFVETHTAPDGDADGRIG